VAVDRRGRGEHRAAHVAARGERVVRLREQRLGERGIAVDVRDRERVDEVGILVAHARRKRDDPVAQRLVATLADQADRRVARERGELAPRAGVAVDRRGGVDVAALDQDARARGRAHRAARPREARAAFGEQELAEQPVEVVDVALARAAPVDEQVAPVQVLEQARRCRIAGQRLGVLGRHRRQERGEHQRAAVLGPRAREDLAGEVREHRLAAVVERGRAAQRFRVGDREPRECSRISTSPAAQPSLARWIASTIAGVSPTLPTTSAASEAVKRSDSQPMRTIACDAIRRAISGGGSARDRISIVRPSGSSASASENAARHSGVPAASWKLSTTKIEPCGNSAKNSRRKRRVNAARSDA
jgi:hypothetical protein